LADAWWISTLPGIAILVTLLALNLVGDWLRDVFDPRQQQVG
jgi:peptide/nickel transport system permease protein